MIKGLLTADSRHWIKDDSMLGGISKAVTPGFGKDQVWAYKCDSCGSVEFSTK